MNKFKIFIFSGVLGCLLFSCADESLSPIITFDSAEKGAYVRLIEESSRLVNLFNISGSSYTYSVEFIDLEGGDLVAEYNLDLLYEGANGEIGPVRLKSFSPSEFTTSEADYKSLSNIVLSATEIISALGLSPDDIAAGDIFTIDGSLVLTTGAVFGAENSSATVNGGAFRGHFDYNLTAGCPSEPSNFVGTYDYTTTDIWCGADPVTGTVDIVDLGDGKYGFSDWSFGAYFPGCYSGPTTDWGDLAFSDVCLVISFTGVVDSFGDTWTFDSSIDGAEWTIDWVNTYGEAAKAVITSKDGEWPFTLK